MLYWRYSPTRTFIINEYWFFFPLAIGGNYLLFSWIRRKNNDRENFEFIKQKIKEQQARKKMYDEYLRKIMLLGGGIGISASVYLIGRGGVVTDVEYLKQTCQVPQGTVFLDHTSMRDLIISKFRKKIKNKVIYITGTAMCKLIIDYGLIHLNYPLNIFDLHFTSLFQLLRKGVGSFAITFVSTFVFYGGPAALSGSVILSLIGTLSLRLVLNNLDYLPTTPVEAYHLSNRLVQPRIPDATEVVILNNNNKLIMSPPQEKGQECWLPEQQFFNPTCGKVTASQLQFAEPDLALPNVEYDDVVNIQDLSTLYEVEFSDQYDLGHKESVLELSKPKIKSRQVNFLDKFGDDKTFGSDEVFSDWDTEENKLPVDENEYLQGTNRKTKI